MKKTKAEFKKAGTSGGKKIVIKIITVGISLLALFLTYVYLDNADRAAQDTVKIVWTKKDIPANELITEEYVTSYDIIRKEYNNSMILYEKKEEILGVKYSSYYIRGSSILYNDQLTDEKPIRNEWIYTLPEGYEIVTIGYNYLEAGGDILLPGDTIRVRVSYEAEETIPADEDNPYDSRPQQTKRFIVTDVLFHSIDVMDMINSNGHSIYEVYKEVMRLNEQERQEVMKSSDFISNIKPRALILAGSSEDMVRYATYKTSVGNGSFLITILSRTGNTIDVDFFAPLETEVRSWIDKGK